jgi:hypothetical protein
MGTATDNHGEQQRMMGGGYDGWWRSMMQCGGVFPRGWRQWVGGTCGDTGHKGLRRRPRGAEKASMSRRTPDSGVVARARGGSGVVARARGGSGVQEGGKRS